MKKNTSSLEENKRKMQQIFAGSFDVLFRDIQLTTTAVCVISLDGMCNEMKINEALIKPLTYEALNSENDIFKEIMTRIYKGTDVKELFSLEEAADAVISGNAVLLAEGKNSVLKFGVQGFPKRAVGEPQSEQNEHGSQEGFNDNFKDNAALLRRRLRTVDLVIEQSTVGKTSKTPALVCYLKGKAEEGLVADVKNRLGRTELDILLGSGYLTPFLGEDSFSFFSDTGSTERPDTLAAMLNQGRVGIITDGSPYAVIVPYLLGDYFHAADDRLSNRYYAGFMRTLRLICFISAAVLPGLFVAVCLFHPEILPSDIMYEIAVAESKTPFPLMYEALIIHIIYEIVREAGLRMPVSIGHAVSIVGALVIGDAAVTAGLIAAPMLIVVALTAISSSVTAKLHENVAIMRFAFIIIGGTTGLYGIMLAGALILIDITALQTYGIPFTVPFSPFPSKFRKTLGTLFNRRITGKNNMTVGEMKY